MRLVHTGRQKVLWILVAMALFSACQGGKKICSVSDNVSATTYVFAVSGFTENKNKERIAGLYPLVCVDSGHYRALAVDHAGAYIYGSMGIDDICEDFKACINKPERLLLFFEGAPLCFAESGAEKNGWIYTNLKNSYISDETWSSYLTRPLVPLCLRTDLAVSPLLVALKPGDSNLRKCIQKKSDRSIEWMKKKGEYCSDDVINHYFEMNSRLRILEKSYTVETVERDIDNDGNFEIGIKRVSPFESILTSDHGEQVKYTCGYIYCYLWCARQQDGIRIIFQRDGLIEWGGKFYCAMTLEGSRFVDAVDMDGDGQDEVMMLNSGYEWYAFEILKLDAAGNLKTVFQEQTRTP